MAIAEILILKGLLPDSSTKLSPTATVSDKIQGITTGIKLGLKKYFKS